MNTSTRAVVALSISLVLFSPVAVAREWKDSSGKFSVEAEFVDLVDGNVRLKKTDGTIITLPLNRLGRKEISFIRQRAATIEKVKRTIEEHSGEPAWLFSALLDGGYSADVGKLPPIDNPIAKQIIARVMNEIRGGKYKPNAKAIPKLLEIVRANNLSGSLTIFPELPVEHEFLKDQVQESRTTTKEFFDEKSRKIVQTESADAKPLQWYKSEWLELGVADDVVRVVKISAKN